METAEFQAQASPELSPSQESMGTSLDEKKTGTVTHQPASQDHLGAEDQFTGCPPRPRGELVKVWIFELLCLVVSLGSLFSGYNSRMVTVQMLTTYPQSSSVS